MSQRLNPTNYARIALVFVELKCESTNSEGGSSLAQLEGGKRLFLFHASVFSVFCREEKIHVSHICKATD